MDRRDFLLKLGVGTAIAVSGYFLLDSVQEKKSKNEPVASEKPRLKSNIQLKEENGMFFLSHERISCCVNNTGRQIISHMDGSNTVFDIAQKISGFYSIEYSDVLVASVAHFVAQLGSAGFLSSPFYATFYENYS